MTTDTNPDCDCPVCAVSRLYPPHQNPSDRIPSIVGIDVSTKYIAIGIVPAMGDINDVGGFGFSLEAKRDPERCAEAAVKTLDVITVIMESVDITSIAIEMPRGFGGKIIPIVGAISGVFGAGNVEWYAPSQWQSTIKKHYNIDRDWIKEVGIKPAIHGTVAENIPNGENLLVFNEDERDALCIALAHRIETLGSTDLSDYDMIWLKGASKRSE